MSKQEEGDYLYTSRKTGKTYETLSELKDAEEEYLKAEREKEELSNQRKARAEEVSAAYNEYQEVIRKATAEIKDAEHKYLNLRNKFAKDYGSYHMTYYDDGKTHKTVFDTVDEIFKTFFLKN